MLIGDLGSTKKHLIGMMLLSAALLCGTIGLIAAVGPTGFPPQTPSPQVQKSAATAFDVDAAATAYLTKVAPDKKVKSDAYAEGGYWLQLWDFLLTAVLLIILLHWRISARMRNLAQKITCRKPLQIMLYWLQYSTLIFLLTFPLTAYEGFVREHQYGMATQTFGPWFWDQTKNLLVEMVLGSFLMVLLFSVIRRLSKTWWIWGAAVSILFLSFAVVIAPVYIAPLFNDFTEVQDSAIKRSVLSLARANGMAVDKVYQVDESRQTTNVSASVNGILGTQRIVLNDNLLRRCSQAEIEAAMAHELGHYVLHHVYEIAVFYMVLLGIGFWVMQKLLTSLLRRWGDRWDVHEAGDVAVLPLMVLLMSGLFFIFTPISNSFLRVKECEADLFALNASRQPDGFAEITLKTVEYRKLAPTRLEEWIFYDHPSPKNRILKAMRWKAENIR